jgi:hypothetical protein
VAGGRSFSQRFGAQMKAGLGLGAGIGAFGLLTDAARRAGEYMGDAIAGGVAEQAQIASLTGVLQANVKGWDGNTAAIEAAMKARSDLGFLDDDMRASMIRLIPVTRDVNRAFDLQAVAMDVARLKTIPLLDASNLVGLAMSGNTRALKQLGIELKTGATKTEILGEIMRVTAGQAEIFAGKMAGTVARVGNTWKEFQDDVGTGVVDALDKAATGLSYMEWRSKAADQAGGGFLGMMTLIPAVADAAGVGIEDYARHLVFNKAAQEGNTAVLTAAGDSMGELTAKYREVVGPLNIYATETDEASDATVALNAAAKDAKTAIETLGDAFDTQWARLAGIAQGAADDIFGPQIRATELAANGREIAAQRAIVASATATAAEKQDAKDRLLALQREGLGIQIEMAGRGELTKTAYATLISTLQTQALSGNEEIRTSAALALMELSKLRTAALNLPNSSFSILVRPGVDNRDAGGPVSAGTMYRVNESRMEYFRPDVNGTVLPLAPAGFGGSGGAPAIIRLEIGGRALMDYVDENLVYRRRI